MLTIFSDADFRWSNGFLIRCIRVNLRWFFKFPVGFPFSQFANLKESFRDQIYLGAYRVTIANMLTMFSI